MVLFSLHMTGVPFPLMCDECTQAQATLHVQPAVVSCAAAALCSIARPSIQAALPKALPLLQPVTPQQARAQHPSSAELLGWGRTGLLHPLPQVSKQVSIVGKV